MPTPQECHCSEVACGIRTYCEAHMECINCGSTAPDVYPIAFGHGRPFPRCAACARKREAVEDHIRELESPCAPADFSEDDAGERWDDDC